MKNLICLIFGHKRITRDWYPHDPITHVDCLRCSKRLIEYPNPLYEYPISKENGKIEDAKVDIVTKENTNII